MMKDRGFGSMPKDVQREIASKGGKKAHAMGTAHQWTSQEAREAGRKGGKASHRNRMEQLADQIGKDESAGAATATTAATTASDEEDGSNG